MNNQEQYVEGFTARCRYYGIDPAALVKSSEDPAQYVADRNAAIARTPNPLTGTTSLQNENALSGAYKRLPADPKMPGIVTPLPPTVPKNPPAGSNNPRPAPR